MAKFVESVERRPSLMDRFVPVVLLCAHFVNNHPQIIYESSTKHPRIICESFTNHLLNIDSVYTLCVHFVHKHPQIIDESFTNPPQIIDQSFTNHPQIIHESSTNHSLNIDSVYTLCVHFVHKHPQIID